MKYIHQLEEWPRFKWDAAALEPLLASVRYRQGLLLGQMTAQGFEFRAEVGLSNLTAEIVQSSAVEGEALDKSRFVLPLPGIWAWMLAGLSLRRVTLMVLLK